MSGLVKHIEKHLGPIEMGWATSPDLDPMPFQVVLLHGNPTDTQALLTLGLSSHPLLVGGSTRRLRQELMFLFRVEDGVRSLPALLQQVGMEAIARDQAYSLGEVLGPRGELCAGSTLEALFVAQPVYQPDSFHVYRPEQVDPIVGTDPVVIAWLVPISRTEAEFVHQSGSERFEQELLRLDPDLLAFNRRSIA